MKDTVFLELFRRYIRYFRDSLDRFERRNPRTIGHYYNKYSLVAEFLHYEKSIHIKSSRFTPQLCEAYFNWLQGKKYKHNYAVRCVEICIDVLNWGAQKGEIDKNPSVYYRKKRMPPAEPLYFTPDQMRLFEHYKPGSSMKQKAADLFLLQLHTGVNYGDFKEIRRHHILMFKGIKYFVKPRHKTNHKQVVPLSAVAEAILEKYDYNLNIISNPKYNQAIKEVAKDLSLPALKSKDGRVIFMMNKLNNEGFSMEAVSRMGGHKTVRTTETYYAQVDINLVHNEVVRKFA